MESTSALSRGSAGTAGAADPSASRPLTTLRLTTLPLTIPTIPRLTPFGGSLMIERDVGAHFCLRGEKPMLFLRRLVAVALTVGSVWLLPAAGAQEAKGRSEKVRFQS